MRRTAIAVAVALVVLAVAAMVWSRSGSSQAQYLTAPVERGDLVVTVAANGTLNPVTLVNVGTQVSGTVRKLHADYNSRVTSGQVLLEIDDSTYAAAVRQSEASLHNALAQVELARANAVRAEDLFAKGYIAQQDLDTARQVAKSAAAQRDLAQAQLDRDRANLGYTVIRSPVSGVVVSREVDVGQTVAASFQTPTLFKIAQDLAKMQIDSNFAEADVGSIKVGQHARFTVDAFPNRTFEGVVGQVRLNPQTVQNVVTYDVVVAVGNPEEILLPGMTAYVNIVLAERTGVLKVPNAALRFHPPGVETAPATAETSSRADGGPPAAARPGTQPSAQPGNDARPPGARRVASPVRSIYVLRNDAPLAVRVQVGGTDRRYTEVTGALKEGDLIVVGLASPGAATGSAAPRIRMF
jgi:HlyD family secretion protein